MHCNHLNITTSQTLQPAIHIATSHTFATIAMIAKQATWKKIVSFSLYLQFPVFQRGEQEPDQQTGYQAHTDQTRAKV